MMLRTDDPAPPAPGSRPKRPASIASAHRARRARWIIRDAYRARPNASRLLVIRYYMIGDSVAAALVADPQQPRRVGSVLVARARAGRRAVRLKDDNRLSVGGWRELAAYIEQLHAKHGAPIARRGASLERAAPKR